MPPLRRFLRWVPTREKILAVFHLLLSAIFECGLDILKDKHSLDFELSKASAAFKTTSRERRKTARGFARVGARTERTAERRSLRLSLRYLKHGHCDLRSCCF